jgi:hypothetical protein
MDIRISTATSIEYHGLDIRDIGNIRYSDQHIKGRNRENTRQRQASNKGSERNTGKRHIAHEEERKKEKSGPPAHPTMILTISFRMPILLVSVN